MANDHAQWNGVETCSIRGRFMHHESASCRTTGVKVLSLASCLTGYCRPLWGRARANSAPNEQGFSASASLKVGRVGTLEYKHCELLFKDSTSPTLGQSFINTTNLQPSHSMSVFIDEARPAANLRRPRMQDIFYKQGTQSDRNSSSKQGSRTRRW
jgi:hypothetical protein